MGTTYTEADQSPTDSSVPISLSNLDGYEWSVIRRELSSATGILPTHGTTGIYDAIRWDCLDHYWQCFHPSFPVVHRPSFLPTKPSPLLASAMVAIGSQYDKREDAKSYSLTLLEVATKLLRRRDNITSRSRLADLQTVFLLEILTKYCSRRTEVEMSSRFRSLFASLDQARRPLATDPLAVFRTLRDNPTADDRARAHKFWLDQETRRRILQASMVLDAQQTLLFEQSPTIVRHEPARRGTQTIRCNVSLPCSDELWETSPVETWSDLASKYESPKPSMTRGEQIGSSHRRTLDYFQTQVSFAASQGLTAAGAYLDDPPRPDGEGHQDRDPRIVFNEIARTMAKYTPIRQLLIVSGESWVLGKKLENESEFQEAKDMLRTWVDAQDSSAKALWHASKLIRSRTGFTTAENSDEVVAVTFQDTHMLHEPWVVYLAALVCWACGFAASLQTNSAAMSGAASTTSETTSNSSTSSWSSGHPTLLDTSEAATEMREYLRATDLARPEDLSRLDPLVLGRIHGLLEMVRLHRIAPMPGGLMNEAERVLYRLVERRSRLSHF